MSTTNGHDKKASKEQLDEMTAQMEGIAAKQKRRRARWTVRPLREGETPVTVAEMLAETAESTRRRLGGGLPDFADARSPMGCVDGFLISVQASELTYCEPRKNFLTAYTKVELGFPSEAEEILLPWAEDSDHPTDTVYPYTPIEVIEAVAANHGGVIPAWRD